MALRIKNFETDRLPREFAQATGEDITDAVTMALRDRLIRDRSHPLHIIHREKRKT